MKSIIKLLAVLSMPVALILLVGVIAFCLHCITDASFYGISKHPLTWIIAVIVTAYAYTHALPEEEG
jgi:hypothetical protein